VRTFLQCSRISLTNFASILLMPGCGGNGVLSSSSSQAGEEVVDISSMPRMFARSTSPAVGPSPFELQIILVACGPEVI